jgi:hypothetical protein
MTHHMTAIKRRDGYQVEHAKHYVDHHHFKQKLAYWYKKRICVREIRAHQRAENDLLSRNRRVLDENESEDSDGCHEKIADGSDDGRKDVIEHRILEISRIDRRWLGPAQNW